MTTILITGSTDGIGLATAKHLACQGHRIVLHGRNPAKLEQAKREIEIAAEIAAKALGVGVAGAVVATFAADLSGLDAVKELAENVADSIGEVDVLVNNAGVYRTPSPITTDGLDVRFVVNTIAPYLLTRRLLPVIPPNGRVINLSSAAQAPVDLDALAGRGRLDDMGAYAQSKLAITMWSRHLADELGADGPAIIAVNPGSLLATNMVKEGFGVPGNDISIGVDVLSRAALSEEFASASGAYFDNDAKRFADPHPDALDPGKNAAVVRAIETILETQR